MSENTVYTGSNFVGGDWENSFGVNFDCVDDAYTARYTFRKHQQGPPGVAHGGAIASLLDEAMTAAVMNSGYFPSFTVKLNIDYRSPVYLDTEVVVSAKIVSVDDRKIRLSAAVQLDDGTVASEANGLFIHMK